MMLCVKVLPLYRVVTNPPSSVGRTAPGGVVLADGSMPRAREPDREGDPEAGTFGYVRTTPLLPDGSNHTGF